MTRHKNLMIEKLADYWLSKKPKKSKIWQWLTYLLTIAMAAYLIYSFTRGGLSLDQIDWRVYGVTILLALSIYLLSLIIQFFVWGRIISFHRKVNWQDVEIYSRMVMMRSLPGGAWHWIGRISMYSGGTEVPTRTIVLGNFLEWVIFTLCGSGIFFATLSLVGIGIPLSILSFCIAIGLAISWQPADKKWISRFWEGSLWIGLYCLAWFLATGILYIFVLAVAGPGLLSRNQALQTYTLTGTLGMLISMLPSSLGVREVTLVWALQDKLTPSMAILIAFMLRIVYTLADAIWGTIGWLVSYWIQRLRTSNTKNRA